MIHKKHYVTFYSPGTLFSEQSSQEIAEWSPPLACKLSQEITERHGAKPYGFRFETRLVSDPVDDGEGGKLNVASKEVASSGIHFITGELKRYDDIPNVPEFRMLRSNMRCNGYWVIVENTNSFKSTLPFEADAILVDRDGNVITKGSDPKLEAYRRLKSAERETEVLRA